MIAYNVERAGLENENNATTTLRSGKTRLQKLFIAQQAAIESERTAHYLSRTVARDAGKIMRDARISQEFAENLARR
jgi:recombinational DNA repair protein RecR